MCSLLTTPASSKSDSRSHSSSSSHTGPPMRRWLRKSVRSCRFPLMPSSWGTTPEATQGWEAPQWRLWPLLFPLAQVQRQQRRMWSMAAQTWRPCGVASATATSLYGAVSQRWVTLGDLVLANPLRTIDSSSWNVEATVTCLKIEWKSSLAFVFEADQWNATERDVPAGTAHIRLLKSGRSQFPPRRQDHTSL